VQRIGITERGDAALDWVDWLDWVSDGQPAILITKDPHKLAERVAKLDKPNIIVHTTITGWGATALEPNVPAPELALQGFTELVSLLGVDRVVLRIDPVIPTDYGILTAKGVRDRATAATRVRVSFIDLYSHVKARLSRIDLDLKLTWSSFHAPYNLRYHAWDVLGQPEVCGEPGFKCMGCLSATDCQILGVQPTTQIGNQRPECACLAMKAELLHRKAQCDHKCAYCYWCNE
jgi:hypothetical protein